MNDQFPVQHDTALGLIKFHLSGFRGYPPSEAGEKVFARGLQECTVSVEHATAVLKTFDQHFPTLREILDTGHSLRAQFEPQESLHAKWEREYGKPVPFDSSMEGTCLCCGRPWAEILAHRAVDNEMWRRIKAHLNVKDFSEVSWLKIIQAKKELGYTLALAEQRALEDSL
jgi:hypothetical protein